MKKQIIIILVVLALMGCALIQEVLKNASWKEGTIDKVGRIFGAKEWIVLTYADKSTLKLISVKGNSEWYLHEVSTVYYEKTILGENIFVRIIKGKHSVVKY